MQRSARQLHRWLLSRGIPWTTGSSQPLYSPRQHTKFGSFKKQFQFQMLFCSSPSVTVTFVAVPNRNALKNPPMPPEIEHPGNNNSELPRISVVSMNFHAPFDLQINTSKQTKWQFRDQINFTSTVLVIAWARPRVIPGLVPRCHQRRVPRWFTSNPPWPLNDIGNQCRLQFAKNKCATVTS